MKREGKYRFDMTIFFEAKEIVSNTVSISKAVERGLEPEYCTIGNLKEMLFEIYYKSFDKIDDADFVPYIEVNTDDMRINEKLSFDDTVAFDVECSFDMERFTRDYHLSVPGEE